MGRRKEKSTSTDASTPARQDEADILAEVGAERDADTGETFADEAKVREVGAMDAESVLENRRLQEIVDKKRGNVPHVPFNSDDVLVAYQHLLRVWPANTVHVSIKRLTGSPVQHTITSQPKTASELYDAIRACHGPNEEATYKVAVIETSTNQYKLNGRITVPDARPPQGQQPMNHYPYSPQQPGYPPQQQPGYAPQYPPPQQPYMQPAPQPAAQAAPQQPAQQPAPVVQVTTPAQPPFDPSAMISLMQQMFGMFQQMQQQAQQQHVVVAQPVQQPPAPAASAMQLPPMPQNTNDPAAMMGWMQQAFGMFQQLQQQAQQQQRAATPPPQPQPQPAQQQPDMLTVMDQMFKMFMQMQQSVTRQPPTQPAYGRGPYLGPRPGTYQEGQQQPPYAQHQPPPYAQPAQPAKSPAEQFREQITAVRTIVEDVRGLSGLWPESAPAAPERDEPEDEAPVKVMDVGDYKLVIDKRDGSARKYETVVANLTPIMKWVGEQREAIQKANAEREQKKQQQLPPGYVEVTPGYQPPPGYVAVPVDQIQQQQQPPQQALPPPPAQMPAPLSEEPQQQPRRTWGAPTIPGGGN